MEDSWLWHKRCYYMNFDNLVRVRKSSVIRGLPKIVKLNNVICKDCQIGKMTSISFKRKECTSKNILDLVHTDLYDLMSTKSYFGDRYFMLFTDDYSKMI